MDNIIPISFINDFIFCPISIYFHNLYGGRAEELYQSKPQIDGKHAHKNVDRQNYSTRKEIIVGIDVFCEEFSLVGKIDIYDQSKGLLTERKNKVIKIYDGYVFQLYAQYYALKEMGYSVSELKIHSKSDNRSYNIPLPMDDLEMDKKFRNTIIKLKSFDVNSYTPDNFEKCNHCIYSQLCDRTLADKT